MTRKTPWRQLWNDIEVAKTRLWEAQAQAYNEFLKSLRMAATDYGEAVDPDSFDELGQPLELEEVESW